MASADELVAAAVVEDKASTDELVAGTVVELRASTDELPAVVVDSQSAQFVSFWRR